MDRVSCVLEHKNERAAVHTVIRRTALLGCFLGIASIANLSHADPALPLKSGDYTFYHRDAEFPDSKGFQVRVSIRG